MSCSTIAQEIRKALKKENINNSDILAVVSNDTLYGVTFASIVAQLGVTGTLTDGSVNTEAIPILSGTAPNFVIRGVAGGNGVTAQAGPSGNVMLSVNMANAGGNADGAQILQSNTTRQFALRRVKAGNGIRVVQNNDNILIENTEVAVSNDTVIISQLADFPDPVGGVITLQDNKDYLLVADVATSNRFVLGSGTVVRAVDSRITTLTYTGAGAMFTTQNGDQSVKEIKLSCPNGTLFDTTSNNAGALLVKWVRVITCKMFGIIHKPVVGMYNIYIDTMTGSGFTFGGAASRFSIEGLIVGTQTSATAKIFDFGLQVFNSLNVEGVEILSSVVGAIVFEGLTAGQNLSTTAIGFISDVNIQGGATALSGIDYRDTGWDFSRCNTIPTTSPNALTVLTTAYDVTVGTVNTPVVVDGGGNFAQQSYWQFDTNVNGRVTYRGKRTAQRDLNAVIAVAPVSGTNKTIAAYIAKNGVVIQESRMDIRTDNGDHTPVPLVWSDLMVTGDYYEVYVANLTDNVNVNVARCILRAD